jgi:hypothetical protein
MNTKKALFYVLAGLLGGCVPVVSIHPLFTKDNVVLDDKIVGTWVDDANEPDMIWQFSKAQEPNGAYKLILRNKEGAKGSFLVHLVKLESQRFLDVYPDEFPCDMNDPNKMDWHFNAFFLVPAHTFIRLDSVGPELKMRLTQDEKLEKLLTAEPNTIAHAKVDGRIVLTASTKELQAFVLKYAADERLFPDETVLHRSQAGAKPRPGDPNSPKQ